MKKIVSRSLIFCLLVLGIYGLGRLYFFVNAGFTISNISSDLTYQPQWEVRPLLKHEQIEVDEALNQPFYYLGKGCQSYVFASEDGKYVIKFIKFQKHRLHSWLAYFPPLPAVVKYRQEKSEAKKKRLNDFVQSWKMAFENLKEETGLLFVHLNKTDHLKHQLTIVDKMGLKHIIDLDKMEFCVQLRARLLCNTLLDYKMKNDLTKAQQVVHRLINMVLSEYSRGLADNDHALMQNTGVVQERPIHVDVGQFFSSEAVKEPSKYHQELFTKTYHFKIWLKEHYPELAEYLESELRSIIGPSYLTMKPKFRQK